MTSLMYHPALRILVLFMPIISSGVGYLVARWKRRSTTLWMINCLLTSVVGMIVLLCAPKLQISEGNASTVKVSGREVPPAVVAMYRDKLGVIYCVIALIAVIGHFIYDMIKA